MVPVRVDTQWRFSQRAIESLSSNAPTAHRVTKKPARAITASGPAVLNSQHELYYSITLASTKSNICSNNQCWLMIACSFCLAGESSGAAITSFITA